jgi:hypothetical protein
MRDKESTNGAKEKGGGIHVIKNGNWPVRQWKNFDVFE